MAETAETPTEQLAHWLHDTYFDVRAEFPGHPPPLWDELSDTVRGCYRLVAARLLTDPPACLREARP